MQQIINGAHSPILFLMKKPAWPDGNVCLGGVPDQLIVPFQRPAASKIAIGDISPFFAEGRIIRLLRIIFDRLNILCKTRHHIPLRAPGNSAFVSNPAHIRPAVGYDTTRL